jgi:type IV pilus assembly protein PilC
MQTQTDATKPPPEAGRGLQARRAPAPRPPVPEGRSLLSRELIPKRVRKRDLEVFTNQLVIMLQAGCDITTALETLAVQASHPLLQRTIYSLHEGVRSGMSLSAAMARSPKVFDQVYVSMVAAGEAAGMLIDTLVNLRDLLRKQIRMRSQLFGALIYPCILLTVAVGALIVLVTFVLPQFHKVFTDAGAELPAITHAVLSFSTVVNEAKFFILGGIAAVVGGFLWFRTTSTGRDALDRLKLKLPLIGRVYQLSLLARITRSLGVLVDSGLPLTDAVELTQATIKNVHYHRFFDALTGRILSGKTITPAFRESGLFRPDICQLVQTGEDTGRVGFVCKTVAEYLEEELSASVKIMTTLLEPAIIIVMAGMIGLVAVSVIEPMFSVSKAVK